MPRYHIIAWGGGPDYRDYFEAFAKSIPSDLHLKYRCISIQRTETLDLDDLKQKLN